MIRSFVFKMSLDLAGSGADIVKCMQHSGDMENFLDNVDHVKCLYDCTIVAGHVYNNKHGKVLTIACCDIQSEDAQAETCTGRILMQSCSIMVSPGWTLRVYGAQRTCKVECCEKGLKQW